MKIALISDVHSNLPALEAVLAAIRRLGIKRVLNAGDNTGYNAFPNETLAMLAGQGVETIKGNHDMACISGDFTRFTADGALAEEWNYKNLTIQSSDYLMGLSEHLDLKIEGLKVAVHHGSPGNPWEYVRDYMVSGLLLEKVKADVLVLGHTHWPYAIRVNGGLVVNPGSVGQPRDGNPAASYLLFDGVLRRLTFYRVAYDWLTAAAKIRAAGLPDTLAQRLEHGL